jgi:dipeptidyl aminopeptidase/acylaminoacyl peptidase
MPRNPLSILALLMLAATVSAQTAYQKPPQVVADVLDAPAFPAVSVSPSRDFIALVTSARYPSIAEVSEPMLRLAGVRINPKTNGPARQGSITALSFMKLADQSKLSVKLPAGKVSSPMWSDDGKRFFLTVTGSDGIGLWVGTVADGGVSEVKGVKLNDAIGDTAQWLSNDELLVQLIPEKRGKAPEAPTAPAGPVVQESSGKAAPVRTYQDMLTSSHDEALFEHFCTSQLAVVKLDGTITKVGEPAIYTGVSPSPTTKYLLVTRLKKPFSYLHPYSAFPKTTEVWDRSGKAVFTVVDAPLQDKVPIEGVPTGPRSIRWVAGEEDQLVWAEALDDGDPKKKVPHRDELFTHAAPFSSKPKSAYKTEHRFSGLAFLRAGNWLVTDLDRERKWTRTQVVEPGTDSKPMVLFDRSVNDRYNDPGTPLTVPLANGQRVVLVKDGLLYLSSAGATPKGELPKLTTYRPDTKESKTLFQCRDGMYESVVAVIDFEKNTFLIRRESPTDPPNYFLKTGDKEVKLTDNKDPFPDLRKVKKQLVRTKRKDGVEISFTLYTPPGVKDGEKLPTVFWAYPREFNDAATAGQVSGSPYRFTTIAGYSHMFFLSQGYAVMDEVSMPIVGKPESANDTFIEQLVTTAEAAINKACEVGPVDRNRIGVGGHSYGAFMTANLIAHSDLFRAGIARSGAYNRTLTPFGFQNERRTFWEAPEVYSKMSPFNNAQKVNEPLLLIHGQADSNPGTFPVQSERMYQAVRGNGGTVRLVLLPHEDHGYSARESIGHVLAEQIQWFDTHVKNAKPRETKGTGEK